MSRLKIVCLHGFWGQPSDWDFLKAALHREGVHATIEAVDLYSDPGLSDSDSLWKWAERFCAGVSGKPVLLGYSMGGRLALHALALRPGLFSGAVIVSADPGLLTVEEKAARAVSDENWARRFEQEPWSVLNHDWNAQPVFDAETPETKELSRRESDFLRPLLAASLRAWSLSRQENLLPRLSGLDLPVLWLAGERDKKYAAILEKVRGLGETFLVAGAGHRVLWDAQGEAQDDFVRKLASFLNCV